MQPTQPNGINSRDRFDILTAEVGDPEPKIIPTLCTVLKLDIENVEQFKSDKLKLIVKHPDRERELIISSVEYIDENQVKTSALWVRKDSKGKIKHNTALAHLLKYYNLHSISNIVGKPIQTTLDTKGYLCIKAH